MNHVSCESHFSISSDIFLVVLSKGVNKINIRINFEINTFFSEECIIKLHVHFNKAEKVDTFRVRIFIRNISLFQKNNSSNEMHSGNYNRRAIVYIYCLVSIQSIQIFVVYVCVVLMIKVSISQCKIDKKLSTVRSYSVALLLI